MSYQFEKNIQLIYVFQIPFPQIEITDFQLKFLHLYANKFYVYFFLLLRCSTTFILGHYLIRRTDVDVLTYMGLFQVLLVMYLNTSYFMGKQTIIFYCVFTLQFYINVFVSFMNIITDRKWFLLNCTDNELPEPESKIPLMI